MPMGGQPYGGMPMMPGPMNGMMNPGMMRHQFRSRMEHMARMEAHLAKIEALLQELVELEKSKKQ